VQRLRESREVVERNRYWLQQDYFKWDDEQARLLRALSDLTSTLGSS